MTILSRVGRSSLEAVRKARWVHSTSNSRLSKELSACLGVRHDATLLPVALGGVEFFQVLCCYRLVVKGSVAKSQHDGIRSSAAKVLDESQGSMDLRFRQDIYEAVQSFLLRHGSILHVSGLPAVGMSGPRLQAPSDSQRREAPA